MTPTGARGRHRAATHLAGVNLAREKPDRAPGAISAVSRAPRSPHCQVTGDSRAFRSLVPPQTLPLESGISPSTF